MPEKKGFTLLHRKNFDNEVLFPPGCVYSRNDAWLDICNQLARGTDDPETGLKRGEFEASIRFLAKRWNWTLMQVRRFLALLEGEEMIEKLRTGSGQEPSLFTVCNYEKYNGDVTHLMTRSATHSPTHLNDSKVRDLEDDATPQVTHSPTHLVTQSKQRRNKEKQVTTREVQSQRADQVPENGTQEEFSARSDSKSSSPADRDPPSPKFDVTIPLHNGSEFEIELDLVHEWMELYPSVDVVQELRAMRGWCIANPKKRKTKRGVLRFINGWLSREQDRGGTQARASPRSESTPDYYRRIISEMQAQEEQ